jgi:hypothetical protein
MIIAEITPYARGKFMTASPAGLPLLLFEMAKRLSRQGEFREDALRTMRLTINEFSPLGILFISSLPRLNLSCRNHGVIVAGLANVPSEVKEALLAQIREFLRQHMK